MESCLACLTLSSLRGNEFSAFPATISRRTSTAVDGHEPRAVPIKNDPTARHTISPSALEPLNSSFIIPRSGFDFDGRVSVTLLGVIGSPARTGCSHWNVSKPGDASHVFFMTSSRNGACSPARSANRR